jgi:glycosyltransferase involved in cell wall biosynthesis
MKIVAWGNDSGSKHWRLTAPLKYLTKRGHEGYVSENGINPLEIEKNDICIVQSCTDKDGIAMLREYQVEHGKKIIVECDDGLDLNEDSPFRQDHAKSDAKFVITRTMEFADMITTTTPYLADQLMVYNDNVKILPNSIDLESWEFPYRKNETGYLRIGWAGSITHLEDVKMIVNPVKKIFKEYPKSQLVIIGDPRVANLFDGLPVEFMNGVPYEVWPAKLHSLQLDIGLAPLRNTYFNKCKSNIKWMEYSIAGIPGVYSPVVYQLHNEKFDGLYGQIAENEDQWYRCIKNYIICPELRDDIAKRARSCVTTSHTLRTNIHLWEEAYESLYD